MSVCNEFPTCHKLSVPLSLWINVMTDAAYHRIYAIQTVL
jgi:hypothetical protein